ncbi:MAG: hypothetical protein M1835_000985 [Candelina submexicana]|nr:MAG: hypothetical protein M1835_000985 [Candelina submexicana]
MFSVKVNLTTLKRSIDSLTSAQALLFTALALLPTINCTPPTCKVQVFVDGYPAPGCVVTAVQDVQVVSSLYVAPGECKDTTLPLQSFRQAITNDAKATTCRLTAFSGNSCTGTATAFVPHLEAQENLCVNYDLDAASGVEGANSFSLDCNPR